MSQEEVSQRPPLIKNPTFRKILRQTLILTSLMVAATAVSSAVNFYLNVWPVYERLSAVKAEANTFRAATDADVQAMIDPSVGWEELARGEGRGKTVKLQGRVGLHHQIYRGAPGGTVFLFPPDAPLGKGDRLLVYFDETEPPLEGSVIEFVGRVTQHDPAESARQMDPVGAEVIKESIPRAILIARPLTVVSPPPSDLNLPQD